MRLPGITEDASVLNQILQELAAVDAAESRASAAASQRGFATEDDLKVLRDCATRRKTLSALLDGTDPMDSPTPQYVTLSQVAAYLQRNKSMVRRDINGDPKAPLPVVEGGGLSFIHNSVEAILLFPKALKNKGFPRGECRISSSVLTVATSCGQTCC